MEKKLTRAEAAALAAYPDKEKSKCITAFGTFEIDNNRPAREGFIKGYEQAEKELALTWKDIRDICQEFIDVNYDTEHHYSIQEKYEEILRRFKEAKK